MTVDERFDSLERLLIDTKESLEREIHGVKESLEREMREGFAQVNIRFDTQAARLERHAGLWQAGTRWSSRMDAWAEKIDSALQTKDHEIAALRKRLDEIEKRQKPS